MNFFILLDLRQKQFIEEFLKFDLYLMNEREEFFFSLPFSMFFIGTVQGENEYTIYRR